MMIAQKGLKKKRYAVVVRNFRVKMHKISRRRIVDVLTHGI